MGQVFRVRDELECRTVALKLLKPELSEAFQLQRFKREFRAAARLDHPHCVRSLEFIEDEGQAVLTMEYVEGGALRLRRHEDPVEVIHLGLQLLAGLDHIHGQRLIHRDLKPGNILVERPPDGPVHARLADFGIAGVMDLIHEDTTVGLVQGSLRYVAPETLASGQADPRSDLYSLGLVLYALLAGQHPFGNPRRSLREWLGVHRRGRIRPLSLMRPELPVLLVEVVHRMCHVDPDERFADAASAHDALCSLWNQLSDPGPLPQHPPLLRRPFLAAPALVGRQEPLHKLHEAHEAGRKGQGPAVVQLSGAPGHGKSRLLRELLVEVFEGDTLLFPGTCRAEGGVPYEPVAELLETLADKEFDGDATPIGALPNHSPTQLAGPDDPTADIAGDNLESPAISMVAELRLEHQPPEDGLSGRLQAHARWCAQLRLLCRSRPVLIVVEDAQWADPPTLQLLTSMVRTLAITRLRGDPVRVCIIVSHRPYTGAPDLEAFMEAAREYGVLTSLQMQALSTLDSTDLLASMLMMPPDEVPEAFSGPLVAQAEGNPLFLSQMLHSLLGRGQLERRDDGQWDLSMERLSAAQLPRSVATAIGERATRLAIEHQQIMVAASVLGREFDVPALSELTGLDELALLDGLDELIRAGFVEDHEHGYRFVHDRIRDAIYDALPDDECRTLHRQAAEYLAHPDPLRPEIAPAAAHHYERAGEPGTAYEFALRAAHQAALEHAHGAALDFYDTATRLAKSAGLELDEGLWELRGDALAAVGRYAQAAEAYAQRLEHIGEGPAHIALLSKVGMLEHKQGHYTRAIELFETVLRGLGSRSTARGLRLSIQVFFESLLFMLPLPRRQRATPGADVLIRTHTLLSECCLMTGDAMRTAHHAMAAGNAARRRGPSPQSARALAFLGMGMVTFGQHRFGNGLIARAREWGAQCNPPASVACSLMTSEALARLVENDVSAALELLESAWQRYGSAASAEARVVALSTISMAMLITDHDPRRSEHYIRRMQALGEELNDPRLRGWAHQHRAYRLIRRGSTGSAIEQLERGLELALETGDGMMAIRALDQLALALALDGRMGEAIGRGIEGARRTLSSARLRFQLGLDGGFVFAAALLLRQGESLPAEAEALVLEVLRRRRRDACALGSSAPLFLVGEAAWNAVHDRPYDFQSPIDAAQQLGYRGEATLARLLAARFDRRDAPSRPRLSAVTMSSGRHRQLNGMLDSAPQRLPSADDR